MVWYGTTIPPPLVKNLCGQHDDSPREVTTRTTIPPHPPRTMAKPKHHPHPKSGYNHNPQQSKPSKGSKGATVAKPSNNGSTAEQTPPQGNQPRNLLLCQAATVPLTYAFHRTTSAKFCEITVRQQNDDATWPGGAVWDLGILLANMTVAASAPATLKSTIGGGKSNNCTSNAPSSCTLTLEGGAPKQYPIQLPTRLQGALQNDPWLQPFWDAKSSHKYRWLELGCGVGLTGLVAAAAVRPRAMILTDLDVVVDQVTRPNTDTACRGALYGKGSTATDCRAVPLCWGNADDLKAVSDILQSLYKPEGVSPISRRKKKGKNLSTTNTTTSSTNSDPRAPRCADVILIGDVAYQHKPGAPSHFEVLHQTLLQLAHNDTLVIFGTRIRMPASVDLLDLLLQDFEEILVPPVTADEIDPASFGSVKHNMSIHFMRQKKAQTAPTELVES